MQKWLSVPAVIITCEGTINEGNSLADIRCRRFSDILRIQRGSLPIFRQVHKRGSRLVHQDGKDRAASTWSNGSARTRPREAARTAGRLRTPARDRCCNSLMNAASLLWIAEAVGIDELTVKIAYEAAVGAGDHRRACGAIRKIITWDMVYACV